MGDLEAQRIRALYRRLVLMGKAKLPLEAGRKLVGPDCAYHLYFRHAARKASPRRRRRSKRGRPTQVRTRGTVPGHSSFK